MAFPSIFFFIALTELENLHADQKVLVVINNIRTQSEGWGRGIDLSSPVVLATDRPKMVVLMLLGKA